MKIKVVPTDFEYKLSECPPGLFLFGDCVGFKTEYGNNEVYVVASGEVFWEWCQYRGATAAPTCCAMRI